jgi:hypothetical protein
VAETLVDFSKLDVLLSFSTSVTGTLEHDAITDYQVYAKNGVPEKLLSSVPDPGAPYCRPWAYKLEPPTSTFLQSLFKNNVFFEAHDLQPTSAKIDLYYVSSVKLVRMCYYYEGTGSGEKVYVTENIEETLVNPSVSVITSYKRLEQVVESFGNGAKSFSYPSSDLLRRFSFTQPNDVENIAYQLIGDYANGKEVATILCEVGEYNFARKGKSESATYNVISQWKEQDKLFIPVSQVDVYENDRVYNVISVNLGYEFPVDLTVAVPIRARNSDDSATFYVTIKAHSTDGTLQTMLMGKWQVDSDDYVTASYNKKRVFSIGDSVCPMSRGADGKEKPISTYSDGTPKIFFVAATKIYYDGAVWQELTLTEENRIV